MSGVWEAPPPKKKAPGNAAGFASVFEGLRWRELVAATLCKLGVEASVRWPDSSDASDIVGLPGVVLVTSAASGGRVSENLAEAEGRARATGAKVGGVVHRHRGRSAEQAYVTLSLEGFARLVSNSKKF
ncbi:hypothetical protein [Agrococcus terreus]|uniref:Uncharacterized protein n=1 Tax=Agrococcus terreus TaxID=574649 RepID=A0ABQ2KFY0_9MICO|nr:hypothetical protein [Agrococcus terreus]GGN82356.1 hypothetical protein GCM10010968_12080 [Agrococcus terreus]